jgi:acylaminoacyl-peptidase
MKTGDVARVTNLQSTPTDLAWSPDGKWLALVMLVPESTEPLAKLPPKPDGAEWAESMKVIRQLNYRADGAGYLKEGYPQIFVVPAEGGTPRQLTRGSFEHSGPLAWTPDGRAILCAANRDPDWEHQPLEEEIFEIAIADGALRQLTKRVGPDRHPVVSPDGRSIAYLGFDDQRQGYQVTRLYVMDRDGSRPRCVSTNVDRDLASPEWSSDGKSLYCQFDDQGVTKIGRLRLDDKLTGGAFETVIEGVGGATIGRPYSSGSYSVSPQGRIALTYGTIARPAEVAVAQSGDAKPRTLTSLNADLLDHKELGEVASIRFKSSADGLPNQAWIMKPPGFDARKKYPLLLEIHGGPFANYGERFSAEMQLYAAAGYVVLYVNPRGSTSYGQKFGNLIHHAYPSQDYDDLMSGVDEAIKTGYVDANNLFVTGGSGGGVLTAWIVGKTNRFRAAVSAKPVINWYSFALTADKYSFFAQYWFPGPPWEHSEHYLKRSPLSLVGAVSTPTMLITGEQDYRTPISESEQFYQALKLRKIDTALVRVPGASHDISARPSHLIGQVAHTLAWFEKYRQN